MWTARCACRRVTVPGHPPTKPGPLARGFPSSYALLDADAFRVRAFAGGDVHHVDASGQAVDLQGGVQLLTGVLVRLERSRACRTCRTCPPRSWSASVRPSTIRCTLPSRTGFSHSVTPFRSASLRSRPAKDGDRRW